MITVKETDTLSRARTLMELHNYSQLPVMRGNRPTGVVSWETIGKALLDNPHAELSDCIDSRVDVRRCEDDLLASIASINATGYILVENADRTISGIVTSADLGEALGDIARPYLLLSEIEETLRGLVRAALRDGTLGEDDVRRSLEPSGRTFSGEPATLTLGDIANILASANGWSALGTRYDRGALNRSLGDVTRLRNKVMHFRKLDDSDRAVAAQLPYIRDVLRKLAREVELGSPPDKRGQAY